MSKTKFHLPTQKEIDQINKEWAGTWYHYYKFGSERVRGMKKYDFISIDNLCTEVKVMYIENNNEHEMVFKTVEFMNEFKRTEKEAWIVYVDWIDRYIEQEKRSITTMEEIRQQIITDYLR